jgi:hypothetical protein
MAIIPLNKRVCSYQRKLAPEENFLVIQQGIGLKLFEIL